MYGQRHPIFTFNAIRIPLVEQHGFKGWDWITHYIWIINHLTVDHLHTFKLCSSRLQDLQKLFKIYLDTNVSFESLKQIRVILLRTEANTETSVRSEFNCRVIRHFAGTYNHPVYFQLIFIFI